MDGTKHSIADIVIYIILYEIGQTKLIILTDYPAISFFLIPLHTNGKYAYYLMGYYKSVWLIKKKFIHG